MLPKDYVRLRLTGEWAIDVADASGTLLLDVAARTWSNEVLDALELPGGWLPHVLESPRSPASRSPAAPSRQGFRSLQGRATARPPRSASGSTARTTLDRDGNLGVVFAALPAFASDSQARVHAFCHAVPGQWHAMGVMLSAAGSLQWFHDRLAPEASFADLVAEAEAWGPAPTGCFSRPISTRN